MAETAVFKKKLEGPADAIILEILLKSLLPDLSDDDLLYITEFLPAELRGRLTNDPALRTLLANLQPVDFNAKTLQVASKIIQRAFQTLSPFHNTQVCRDLVVWCKLELQKSGFQRVTKIQANKIFKASKSVFVKPTTFTAKVKSELFPVVHSAHHVVNSEAQIIQSRQECDLFLKSLKRTDVYQLNRKLGRWFFQTLSPDDFILGTNDDKFNPLLQLFEDTSLNITDVVCLFGLSRNGDFPPRLWSLGYNVLAHIFFGSNKCCTTSIRILFPGASWKTFCEMHVATYQRTVYQFAEICLEKGMQWLSLLDIENLSQPGEMPFDTMVTLLEFLVFNRALYGDKLTLQDWKERFNVTLAVLLDRFKVPFSTALIYELKKVFTDSDVNQFCFVDFSAASAAVELSLQTQGQ